MSQPEHRLKTMTNLKLCKVYFGIQKDYNPFGCSFPIGKQIGTSEFD